MNNDRDYIRAIDKYIEENYGVDTLFYQGELSYQHINKKSTFSSLTFISGCAALLTIIAIIYPYYSKILVLIRTHPLFILILSIEIIGIVVIIIKNMKYKMTGKSNTLEDCYLYLTRNKKI